jgi:ATP-dependent protease HslVU (ClpYQ) peptidase subunit
MQRIDEEDVLLLSIAREIVRNERSVVAIGRNGEYAREIESLY